MATKPTESFTWATDASYGSGPDSGNPTKVNPPGYPAVVQGSVPGLGIIASFTNKIRNVLGDWTVWLLAGSSAGAQDAHLVETGSDGETSIRRVAVQREVGTLVDVVVGADVTIRSGSVGCIFQLDNSTSTGVHTVTVDVPGTTIDGEQISIVFRVQDGTNAVAIASFGGGANPIYTSDILPTLAPDYVDLVFDASVGASGEWLRQRHGQPA